MGLRSIYSYIFRASKREAARIEKRMLKLEFHIQAWSASKKKNLSDVVLREIHCADLGLAGSPLW